MIMKDGYSPTQLLGICTINAFGDSDKRRNTVTKILAILATEKSPDILIEKISALLYEYGKVSIGQALRELHSVAGIGDEFDGGLTGLDALAYHLDGITCSRAITALQGVLTNFNKKQ
jgi:hypothetical protein